MYLDKVRDHCSMLHLYLIQNVSPQQSQETELSELLTKRPRIDFEEEPSDEPPKSQSLKELLIHIAKKLDALQQEQSTMSKQLGKVVKFLKEGDASAPIKMENDQATFMVCIHCIIIFHACNDVTD